ncbi:MAG: NAD(P)-binding domain-containing protein [Nitrososphaerota archaeon]|nr:NAD(P)-binding domain-containing protein [Nitrososphaerota archaeon]
MKPNVGIIGKGNVGSAVKRGLEKAGYQVRAVGRDLRGVACARAASAPLPRFS